MDKTILITYERCTQCHSCEIACGIEKSASKELTASVYETPPPQPRIFFKKIRKELYPVHCRHCVTAPCITACPTGALGRDKLSGAVVFHAADCTACFACLSACPAGVIRKTAGEDSILKCDLCYRRLAAGGQPACVDACPTRAIEYLSKTGVEYVINPDICRACGKCKRSCPEEAVAGEKKKAHAIIADKCRQCGVCYINCPFGAIEQRLVVKTS